MTTTATNEIESLTAGLMAPLLMTDAQWTTLSRNTHTDIGVRLLLAGDWFSVDVQTGALLVPRVSPETTVWHTRSKANFMLRMSGKNIDTYVQSSVAMFLGQFADDLDDTSTVSTLALTYGPSTDEKAPWGISWRAILMQDFNMTVRGMEHRLV